MENSNQSSSFGNFALLWRMVTEVLGVVYFPLLIIFDRFVGMVWPLLKYCFVRVYQLIGY